MSDDDLQRAARRAPTPRTNSAAARALTRGAIRVMPVPRVSGVSVTRRAIANVPVRVYSPKREREHGAPMSALMWIHGGGYVIGHPRQDDHLCKTVAKEANCVVVSPDYRLAPRHPFPAAHDDCVAVWAWLTGPMSDLGTDAHCTALGGQSAGGGLALGLALSLRDNDAQAPAALWLFAPMIDDTTAAKKDQRSGHRAVWTNVLNHHAWNSYLATAPGAANVSPYAAPARAIDLSGLPPMWLGVGDVDLFHDEVVTFAERARSCGGNVELVVVTDGFHGFETLARKTSKARAYVADAVAWLQSRG